MLAPVFALATEGQRNRGARREGTPADWTGAAGKPSGKTAPLATAGKRMREGAFELGAEPRTRGPSEKTRTSLG